MRLSLILGHPRPGSFNHAIAERARCVLCEDGHVVRYHDLYAEGFDPILPAAEIPRDADLAPVVARHCDEIASAGEIVIVHPNWWGQPPAIVKGWVDRVLRPGVAYAFAEGDSGEGIPIGLLAAHGAVVLNTSNTHHEREMGVFGDPLQALWADCIFRLCGVRRVQRRMFGVVVTSTLAQRQAWLDEVARLVRQVFPRALDTQVQDPAGTRYYAVTYEPPGYPRAGWEHIPEVARRVRKEWHAIPRCLAAGHIAEIRRDGDAYI
jgi:putative NADPH-quinone reductase